MISKIKLRVTSKVLHQKTLQFFQNSMSQSSLPQSNLSFAYVLW